MVCGPDTVHGFRDGRHLGAGDRELDQSPRTPSGM
jgi:hypothetical protein